MLRHGCIFFQYEGYYYNFLKPLRFEDVWQSRWMELFFPSGRLTQNLIGSLFDQVFL